LANCINIRCNVDYIPVSTLHNYFNKLFKREFKVAYIMPPFLDYLGPHQWQWKLSHKGATNDICDDMPGIYDGKGPPDKRLWHPMPTCPLLRLSVRIKHRVDTWELGSQWSTLTSNEDCPDSWSPTINYCIINAYDTIDEPVVSDCWSTAIRDRMERNGKHTRKSIDWRQWTKIGPKKTV